MIEGYVDERLDDSCRRGLRAALTRLEKAGARLMTVKIRRNSPSCLSSIATAALANSRPTPAIAIAWRRGPLYDPWVRARFGGGRDKSAADYIDLLAHRARLRASVDVRTGVYDALALPTVPIVPPTLAELEPLDVSRALNLLILRNTVIANFLDRPAVSIPATPAGAPPVGFMLMGETDGDRRLLAVAAAAEAAIRAA